MTYEEAQTAYKETSVALNEAMALQQTELATQLMDRLGVIIHRLCQPE